MRSDLTDITLVVDRSGSMQEIRSDAEGGVVAFIENQAKEPGEALLTIVQFDTEYEFLCKGVPISQAPVMVDSVPAFEPPNGTLMRAGSLTYQLSLTTPQGQRVALGTRTVVEIGRAHV